METANLLAMMYSVLSATDRDDLVRRMDICARAIGCEHFMLGLEVRRPALQPVQHVTSGYPPAWQQRYAQRGYIRLDPTIPHCQEHVTPLVWHDGIYSAEAAELREESHSHGIGHGVSIGVHEAGGIKSMVSVARDQAFIDDARERERIVQAASVLAACAHVAASRLILPGLLAAQTPHLTPRERDCLSYVMAGKSTSVIADLMNIAEPTVEFHVRNTMRKLGVATRVQAVAKAVSLGLIA